MAEKDGIPVISDERIPSFMVNDVKMLKLALEPIDTLKAARLRIKKEVVEAVGFGEFPMVKLDKMHGFISAIGMAYDKHMPLSLSPSHFWLMIAQAVAKHIEINSERLRSTFVGFEEKKYIEVRRDEFSKGDPNNDWVGCFDEFSAQIRKNTKGDHVDTMVLPFSTTSAVEKAAFEVTLMDSMKNYFEFGCLTCCGFPRIYLEGTVHDWEDLHSRVTDLHKLDLEDNYFQSWCAELRKVSAKLEESARGNPDIDYWNDFFKLRGGSGGPFINGWINVFFPYVETRRSWVPYPAALDWKNNDMYGKGDNLDDMPSGLSAAPFTWCYYNTDYAMKFVAGFFGVEQNPQTLALRPGVGWAVVNLHLSDVAKNQRCFNENVEKMMTSREDKLREISEQMGPTPQIPPISYN